MTFLNPIGLAGLISLPVILALHLLYRRKKRYIVSHLGLWSFVDAQTRGPRARRVPLTWILLLDLLIGALLSLAWSRPSIAAAPQVHPPRHWVILLDVSTSMRALDGPTTRFEQARAEAAGLLREAAPGDVVTLLTFGEQARIAADSRQGKTGANGSRPGLEPAGLSRLFDALNGLHAGETGHALAEALAMGQAALDPSLPAEFHVITDGDFPLPDPGAISRFADPLHWHWVGKAADNQAVLDLNATPLGDNLVQVFARLANFGSRDVTRPAILSVDGRIYAQDTIGLPAGSSVPHVWQISLKPGETARSITVSLSGSDALAEDDSAAIGLQPGGKIRVALVADDPAPLQQAVQAAPNVDLSLIAPTDYANALARSPSPFDLTVFRNFLPPAWPQGKILLVDPPEASGQPVPVTGALPPGAEYLLAGPGRSIPAGSPAQAAAYAGAYSEADASPLVAGIDFSGVRWSRVWTLAGSPPGFTPLLEAGGLPILLQGQVQQPSGGQSQAIVLLADLTQGNFVKHPAFPILIANLVDLARQAPLPAAFQTGDALPLPSPGSYRSVQITPPQGQTVQMDQTWPEQWTNTLDPGLYRFQLTGADGSLTEFTSGARAGDAVESDLNPRGWVQQIAAAGDQAAALPDQQAQKLDLSGWLLGAAVLVLLMEAILAWRR